MGKFVITEEEKKYIKSLYEQQTSETTQQKKVIEINSSSDIPQALVDGAPPICTYDSHTGTYDNKGQYLDLCLQDGTCYRVRPGKFNYTGYGTPGKLFAELNTLLLSTQKTKTGDLVAKFDTNNNSFTIPASEIVKNSSDKWIGFKSSDKSLQFACFVDVKGSLTCRRFDWYPADAATR